MPSRSSPLRVLHIGNIANNAHNIAKALRQRCGIEADCYTNYYNHYISQPEWEDADIGPVDCDDHQPVAWDAVPLHGYQRPAWYFETKDEAVRRMGQLTAEREYTLRMTTLVQTAPLAETDRALWQRLLNAGAHRTPEEYQGMRQLLRGQLPLRGVEFPTAQAWRRHLEQEFRTLCVPPHSPLIPADYESDEHQYLPALLQHYDIIQTYGAWELFIPLLHAPAIPRVTFEHGTMRDFPYAHSAQGRRAMLAYRTAFANIITNADAIHNARRMGLHNHVFIPHPVDDEKFHPREDAAFRAALLREHDATHLFYAPARQNWDIKGNDRVLHAFATVVRRVGRGPKLLLGAWGQEVARTTSLIRALQMDDHVAWIPPLPKRALARYLNACDAVLDQFILGAFGTTTPEAMACAKPVLLYYNAADHRWCLPEDPPVINVHSAEDIGQALCRIIDDPAWAAALGRQGAEWFARHHSLDVVVQRHMEIYRRVENAPQCFQVPAALSQGEQQPMTEKYTTCVVDAENATAESVGTWLQGVQGQSALAVLDARLRRSHRHLICVLALAAPEPALEREARKLGWLVYCPPRPLTRLLLKTVLTRLKTLLCTEFVYICDLEQPFIDAGQLEAWRIGQCEGSTIVSGESRNANPYIPQKIYSRAFVIYRALLRRLFRGAFTRLQCQSIMVRYGLNMPAPELPASTAKLTLRNFADIAPHLSPVEFTVAQLQELPPMREVLLQAITTSSRPHLLNEELNALECRNRDERLHSFPTHVGLNMTSRCSARCVFCSIQPGEQKIKDFMALEEVKRMDWLRHVSAFSLWGGIGDSLVNKEFAPIVRHVHEQHPHLKLDLFTNGILMNEELCHVLANSLSSYNVSLNAARKDTWERVMRAKGFDNVCATFARMGELRSSRATLAMNLFMVLTRDTIDEAVPFVDLAHSLGADNVTFVHYAPSTLVGRRDLPVQQSLYFDREHSDAVLEKAAARAEALGIGYAGPTLFGKKADHIHFGARAMTDAPPCLEPWKRCYLTVDEDGNRQMIFCCSGFYYAIDYDKGTLDENAFRALWNHPTARYFRHTVHRPGENPICAHCTTVDRFHPENRQHHAINTNIQPYLAEVNARYRAGEDVSVEEMRTHIQKLFS